MSSPVLESGPRPGLPTPFLLVLTALEVNDVFLQQMGTLRLEDTLGNRTIRCYGSCTVLDSGGTPQKASASLSW